MKKIIVLFFIPFIGFTQNDTTFNTKAETTSMQQNKIYNLVSKYKGILISKDGIEGWRLKLKFTSKREEILAYQVKFTNLYPEIPAQITFESPYYKLTIGNFKTKNESLKIKNEISKNFPGAHPISIILDPNLLRK